MLLVDCLKTALSALHGMASAIPEARHNSYFQFCMLRKVPTVSLRVLLSGYGGALK
jgi:hypothetical protein